MRVLALLFSLHFLLVSLLPGGDAHELHDLPDAWVHHQSEHATDGLWSFFVDHYLDDHQHDAEHHSLPCHHAHECTGQIAALPPQVPALMNGSPLVPARPARTFAELVSAAPTRAGTGAWQPPRA